MTRTSALVRLRHLGRPAGIVAGVACSVVLVASASAATPPTVTTAPVDPTLTTDTYALLGGTINPQGQNVAYKFQWGADTTYGQTTPVTSAGNGKAEVPVDYALDTLTPSTTYHYRLVILENNGTEIDGADATFTTAASPALAKGADKAGVLGSIVSVKVKASGPADSTVDGVLSLRGKVGKRTVSLGSGTYSIATGTTGTVKVRLNAAGLAARKYAKGGLRIVGGHLKKVPASKLTVTASAKTTDVKAPATWKLTLG